MLTSDARALKDHFGLDRLTLLPEPRYDIAPTQQVVSIVRAGDETILESFRWGLVPRWANDLSIGSKMINARAETVAERPAYKTAFAKRRCLIPTNGFYEWQRGGDEPGPRRFEVDGGGLFAMCGLWESWFDPNGLEIRTCTVITTTANGSVSNVHHRMPAILGREGQLNWLDQTTSVADLLSLIVPTPTIVLNQIRVPKMLNGAEAGAPTLFDSL